jgi:hypothetical protein
MAAERRFLHDDEARALQMAHDALRSDSRHVFVGLVNALAPFESQRESDRVREVARVGWRELLVGVNIRGR